MSPIPTIAALLIALALPVVRGESPPPAPDPNLPPDYLEQILKLERREYSNYSIPDFMYVDPATVRVGGGDTGSPARQMTAVEVFLSLRSKNPAQPVFGFADRLVLFAKGSLVRDVRPDDPAIDRFTDEPRAPIDPNLPADYREQILRRERQRSPNYSISTLGCSDPVRVLVRGPSPADAAREMTAVGYSYGPASKADGQPYFMVIQGTALFSGGVLVRSVGSNDGRVEWVNGRPAERPNSPEENQRLGRVMLKDALALHDPIEGPAERRTIRRQIWARYKSCFEAMALSPETVTRLVALLEANEEAPLNAQFKASRKGIDPFSAQMSHAVDQAKASAKRDLDAFFGKEQLDTLEYLSSARGYYEMVMANGIDVQWDLRDAGIPMTPRQIVAVGKICEDVCDPKRNPNYSSLFRQPADPVTGISAAYQAVLDRAAKILSADQIGIIRLSLSDKAIPGAAVTMGRSADPGYGAAARRWDRRRMMADYEEPLAEMSLPAGVGSKVKDLLVERESAPRIVMESARNQGLDLRSDEVRKAMSDATAAVDRQLKTLLGAPDYDRLEDLKNFNAVRSRTQLLEIYEFDAEDCPLTPDQLQAFSQIVWNVQKSIKPPSRNGLWGTPTGPKTDLAPREATILTRSTAILTARQQEVLRTYYRDQSANLKRIATGESVPKTYPPGQSG